MENMKEFFRHYNSEVFIKYFTVFRDNRDVRSNKEIYMAFKEDWSKNSCLNRASKGKKIFKLGQEVEALDYIIYESKRVSDSVKEQAMLLRRDYN